MIGTNYNDLSQYPANPYIRGGKTPQQGPLPPAQPQGATALPGTPAGLMPDPGAATPTQAPAQDMGWWAGPEANAGAWSQQAFSPEFNQARQGMYGWYGDTMQNMPNLAGMYQGYLQQSPQLEQMQYNQALARLKGQYGTAMQGLTTGAGAMRGGNRGGALQAGIQGLGRQLMGGTMDIATQQAMQNLADRERRQMQLIGLTGQDFTNRLSAGGAMQGWLGQEFPTQQYAIDAPYNRALAEEQINAQRRGESMSWFDRMMAWQNQQAQQGLGYTGMRSQAELGGYTPDWLNWAQY